MIFVSVPIIRCYFGGGSKSRERLEGQEKYVTLSSPKGTTVELSTIWHYLFVDSVIDLMFIEHLLYD